MQHSHSMPIRSIACCNSRLAEKAFEVVVQWLSNASSSTIENNGDIEKLSLSKELLRTLLELPSVFRLKINWRSALGSARGQHFPPLLEAQTEGRLDFHKVCKCLARWPVCATYSWGDVAMDLVQVPADGLCILMAASRSNSSQDREEGSTSKRMLAFETNRRPGQIRAMATLHVMQDQSSSSYEYYDFSTGATASWTGGCSLIAESSLYVPSLEQGACSLLHVPASALQKGSYMLGAKHRRSNGMHSFTTITEVLPFFGPSFNCGSRLTLGV